MKHMSKHKKVCTQKHNINTYNATEFCYKFNEAVDNWDYSTPTSSQYWFNEQKRDVPTLPTNRLLGDDLTENCAFYCDEELGGMMTFDEHSSLIPGRGLVSNSISSYEDLDDMCSTCAA